MKCEDLLRQLNDYVDKDIDPDVCTDFEGHLQDCNPCKIVVDTIRKTIKLYKDDTVYEMPIKFHDRLHQTLRDRWKNKMEENDG